MHNQKQRTMSVQKQSAAVKLYLLSKLEFCHELWVSPNSVTISCWTPLNSPSCFPAWACCTEARHSACPGDLTHRKWKVWMCMCPRARVRACVHNACESVGMGGGGGGGEGGETGYVGNNTKHKKCHMIWNTELIYLASERICCMWFGGENVFLLCSQPLRRHNTWKHFLRGHGSVKKEKLQTFYFFSLFSPAFFPPSPLFKLIELHTSARHM